MRYSIVLLFSLLMSSAFAESPKNAHLCDQSKSASQCCDDSIEKCFNTGKSLLLKEHKKADGYFSYLCQRSSSSTNAQALGCYFHGVALEMRYGNEKNDPALLREGLEAFKKSCSLKGGEQACVAELTWQIEDAQRAGNQTASQALFDDLNKLCLQEKEKKACESLSEIIKPLKATQAKIEKKIDRQDELICKCRKYQEYLQGQIDHETEVGKVSGFVNSDYLHRTGSMLLAVRDFQTKLENSRNTLRILECSKKYTNDQAQSCWLEMNKKSH